jgi:hypothetical protein
VASCVSGELCQYRNVVVVNCYVASSDVASSVVASCVVANCVVAICYVANCMGIPLRFSVLRVCIFQFFTSLIVDDALLTKIK